MDEGRRFSWRATLAPAAAALAAGVAAGLPSTAAAADACTHSSSVVCSTVQVPLDYSGRVPGTISLHVEMLPAEQPRGVAFLLAGGPGQGSADAFALTDKAEASYLRFLLPDYTLVAYDDRGTGSSAPLSCDAIAQAADDADPTQVAADCAAELGSQIGFYRTVDHAADLDAVRRALGFDRIALLGVSYGTRQALAYAATYPTHVERLVLDSVESPAQDLAFESNVLRELPGTLASFCAGGRCAAATRDFPGDVAAVAASLAAQPRGLTAVEFLDLVVGTDLNPGIAAELPAAVHAARGGDWKPLQHVTALVAGAGDLTGVDDALYVATVCDDGPFPWTPATALGDRVAATQASIAGLGPLGPFGSWAADLGVARLCAGWPTSGGSTLPTGALPDVPVLAVSGGLDLRTPTAGAAAVVASFPQGKLLVVPGAGHSVLSTDTSLCAQLDLRSWLKDGDLVHPTCDRGPAFLAPLAAFPAATKRRLTAAASVGVAVRTLREAEAAWLATTGMSGEKDTVRGLYGGRLVGAARSFTLDGYTVAPGLTLSGRVTATSIQPPLVFAGSVRVGGSEAAHGRLRIVSGTLKGRLGRSRR